MMNVNINTHNSSNSEEDYLLIAEDSDENDDNCSNNMNNRSRLSFISASPNSMVSIAISNSTDLSTFSDCFICFENDESPIKLEDISTTVRNCQCRGNIHTEYLKRWVIRERCCPICRTPYSSNLIIIRNDASNIRLCISLITSFFIFLLFLSVMAYFHK